MVLLLYCRKFGNQVKGDASGLKLNVAQQIVALSKVYVYIVIVMRFQIPPSPWQRFLPASVLLNINHLC